MNKYENKYREKYRGRDRERERGRGREYNRGNRRKSENKENEGNVLDKLFFKTKTKPYIYYLPLTEEQVKQKLENKNK